MKKPEFQLTEKVRIILIFQWNLTDFLTHELNLFFELNFNISYDEKMFSPAARNITFLKQEWLKNMTENDGFLN